MRRHLKAWINSRRSKRGKEKEVDPLPEVPYLPSSRPLVLTPSSSTQDLSLLTQSSPIFSKLPSEVRRQILLFAFGDRTIHMDLVLEHPTKSEIKDPDTTYHYHANLKTRWNTVDTSQPRIWKWKGCVCHRVAPLRFRKIIHFDEYVNEPADDECCSGEANPCPEWTRHYETTDACLIGVMGWLLACRQSYVEGLDVLYHTNIIHLSRKALILDLPKLFLPQRVAMMTSLEIVWLINSNVHSGKSILQQSDLNEILSILDLHFPRLQRLKLALKLRLYDKIPVQLDGMINTLDSFVARRTQYLLEPITISLASWAFEQLYDEAWRGRYLQMALPESPLRYKVWRYLDGKYAFAPGVKIKEIYGVIEGTTAKNGYWFRLGDDKERQNIIVEIACFGSGGGMSRDGRFVNAPRNPTWNHELGRIV